MDASRGDLENSINNVRDRSMTIAKCERRNTVLFGLMHIKPAFLLLKLISCLLIILFVEELSILYHMPSGNMGVTPSPPRRFSFFLNASFVSISLVILFFINIVSLYGFALAQRLISSPLPLTIYSSTTQGCGIVLMGAMYSFWCLFLVYAFEASESSDQSHQTTNYRMAIFSMKAFFDMWNVYVEIQAIRYISSLPEQSRKMGATSLKMVSTGRYPTFV